MRVRKELVNEAKQVGTLYHICTLDAVAEYIAPTNILSSSGRYTNYILNTNKVVSLTRDKNYIVSTGRNRISPFIFRFSINGDKLSEKYKIVPYNDLAFKYGGKEKSRFDPKDLEKEEVLVGEIKNFSEYVLKVDYSVNINLFDSSIPELKKIINEFSNSISYLSSFSIVYNNKLKLNEDVFPSFKSLEECRTFLTYLLKLYICTASKEELEYLLRISKYLVFDLYEGFFSGLYSPIAEKGIEYLPIFYKYGVDLDVLIGDYSLAFPDLEEQLKKEMSFVPDIEDYF